MNTRQAVAAGLAATCAVLLAGCSDDETAPPVTPTTPTAAVTPTPSISPATAAVLQTYLSYWKARVQAQADPTKSLPKNLTRYGSGDAVSDVRATVLLFRQQGIELRGEPTLSPEVTDVSASTASITDCVDSRNWKPVYAATGKSALAPGQSPRVVMTATAVKNGDDWQIATAKVEKDRTC